MEKQRLTYLLTLYAAGTLSEEERAELRALSTESASDAGFNEQLQSLMANSPDEEVNREEWKEVLQGVLATDNSVVEQAPVKQLPTWRRYWMAASVLLLLGIGSFYWFADRGADRTVQPAIATTNDIAAGQEGAILTLSDGTRIVLDSLPNGQVASQQGSKLMLQNGMLTYDGAGNHASGLIYNTMSTPRGRQFQLMLPDGSMVWLNAGSSIKYPVRFEGRERQVEVEGEAFFQVTPRKDMPFRVSVNGQPVVEVLGTAFNINAYKNETGIYTTLVQGSVRVSNGKGATAVLKPAQRAGFSQSEQQIKITSLDEAGVNSITAWKSGYFNFEGMSLQEAMHQLERWYDIEVSYENGFPKISFWGKLERSLSLEALLQSLKGSRLNFRREGERKLVIINSH